jgi:hypothetical protein
MYSKVILLRQSVLQWSWSYIAMITVSDVSKSFFGWISQKTIKSKLIKLTARITDQWPLLQSKLKILNSISFNFKRKRWIIVCLTFSVNN